MKIKYTVGSDPDFIDLAKQLDDHLNDLAAGEENRAEYVALNALDDIHNVWLAYENDVPVGCASFKKLNETVAEVKRVFVRPEHRKKGIAEKLLQILEAEAGIQGIQRLLLETNDTFDSAISLYRKLGYEIIDNYEPYADMPVSVCMGKTLPALTSE